MLGFALLMPELPKTDALELGLNIHIALLTVVIFFGATALIFLRATRHK